MGKKLVSDLLVNYLERRGITKLFCCWQSLKTVIKAK